MFKCKVIMLKIMPIQMLSSNNLVNSMQTLSFIRQVGYHIISRSLLFLVTLCKITWLAPSLLILVTLRKMKWDCYSYLNQREKLESDDHGLC
jgi:hypothetical protein